MNKKEWLLVVLLALVISAAAYLVLWVMQNVLGHSTLGALGLFGFIGLFGMRCWVVKKSDEQPPRARDDGDTETTSIAINHKRDHFGGSKA